LPAASALAAGNETLGYALLEAYAQCATDVSSPVLLVYADEPADPAYGEVEDEVEGGALAILLDATVSTGRLECALVDDSDAARPSFSSQSRALQYCLDTRAASEWPGKHSMWQWSWHEGV